MAPSPHAVLPLSHSASARLPLLLATMLRGPPVRVEEGCVPSSICMDHVKQEQMVTYFSTVFDGSIILASLLVPGCSGKILVAREAERHTDHGSAAEVLDLFEPVAGEAGLLKCSTTRGATSP